LADPPHVEVPVTDAIEASGDTAAVVQLARCRERPLRVRARYGVVARGPQQVEVHQKLPGHALVASGCCQLESSFIVRSRELELAKTVIGLTTSAEHIPAGRLTQPHGRLDSVCKVFDRGARCVHQECPLASRAGVPDGRGPRSGGVRVIGQLLKRHLVTLPRELLQRRQHFRVHCPSLPSQQVSVDSLQRQGMPKGEPLVRFLDHELRPDQLLEDRQQLAFVDAEQHLEQRKVEATAGDGRDLRGAAGVFAKAVHAA
jgi:hypothetical protein